MQFLRQSTAATVTIGPILDSAGAEYTGAVIGDISIRKHDGTSSAALASAATLTHDANGMYKLVLTTGNTDTLGRVDFHCNKSTYQMPPKCYDVVSAMIYDSLVLGTDVLQADVTQLLGTAWLAPGTAGTPDVNAKLIGATAQTGRDIGASVLLSSGTGTGQIKIASGYVAPNWGDVGNPMTTVGLSGTTVGTVTTLTGHTAQTGDTYVRLGAPAGASHAADVAAVKVDTAAILDDTGTSGVALAADSITSTVLATNAVQEIRNAITGGAYAFDTDANGRIRIVDGTGAGEINTNGGAIVQVDQLGTQAKADVNAELVDVVAVDTYAEPGQGNPAATTTLAVKLGFLYKAWRNKTTQDASEYALYADDGVTKDQEAGVSDNGTTFTRNEMATGA